MLQRRSDPAVSSNGLSSPEFTTQLATLQPPPPELQQVLDAVHGDQEAMDGFARVGGAVTSPADFFSEQNVGRLLAGAREPSPWRHRSHGPSPMRRESSLPPS
jgi:hypothetical protein